MLHYLKFLLRSTNHHGVHSPFVYTYLTKCLYKKPRLSKNRLEDVISKSIAYFGIKNAQIDDPKLKNRFSSLSYEPPFDMVVLNDFKVKELFDMLENDQIHNDSQIIIQDLRKQLGEWKKAIAHPKITVSMDYFSLGIVFVRKEQVKEHFTIRL